MWDVFVVEEDGQETPMKGGPFSLRRATWFLRLAPDLTFVFRPASPEVSK